MCGLATLACDLFLLVRIHRGEAAIASAAAGAHAPRLIRYFPLPFAIGRHRGAVIVAWLIRHPLLLPNSLARFATDGATLSLHAIAKRARTPLPLRANASLPLQTADPSATGRAFKTLAPSRVLRSPASDVATARCYALHHLPFCSSHPHPVHDARAVTLRRYHRHAT